MAQLGSWITETGHIPSARSGFQHSLACRIKVACTGWVSITLMPLDEAIAEHLQAKMCSWHPKCAKHINANFQPIPGAYHEPWAPTGSVSKVFSSGFSDYQILLGEASAGLLSQAFHDLTSDLAVCSRASCSLSIDKHRLAFVSGIHRKLEINLRKGLAMKLRSHQLPQVNVSRYIWMSAHFPWIIGWFPSSPSVLRAGLKGA